MQRNVETTAGNLAALVEIHTASAMLSSERKSLLEDMPHVEAMWHEVWKSLVNVDVTLANLRASLDQEELRADREIVCVYDCNQQMSVLLPLISMLSEFLKHDHETVPYSIDAQCGRACSVVTSSINVKVGVLCGAFYS